MKLIVSNGRDLRVYDISGPINHLVAGDLPIKLQAIFSLKTKRRTNSYATWQR